jgi:hypothetical protein
VNAIESALQAGPKKYQDLRGLLPVYQLDAVLKGLLQAKRIRITTRGFDLPAKSPADEELPKTDFTVRGYCYCGNPIYRKGARFCSHSCHAARQVKERPVCKMCGNPVIRGQIKYCGVMCRAKSDRGKKPKGALR